MLGAKHVAVLFAELALSGGVPGSMVVCDEDV